jgi:hypothetical protein
MKKTYAIGFILFLTLTIVSCGGDPKGIEKTKEVYSEFQDMEDTSNYPECSSGGAHSGKFFSRVDSVNQYGKGIYFNMPDSLVFKDLRLVVSAWVRMYDNAPEKMIGISLNETPSNKILKWYDIKPANKKIQTNNWVLVTDSFTIDATLNASPDNMIQVFPYNSNKIGAMDVDDIRFSLKTIDTLFTNP